MSDNNGPILTVIVPAYNAEKTIGRCIDSILNQGDAALEVIVSNDGSSDCTWNIIQEYIEKDTRVKGVSDVNGGVSTARNRAIKIAKGQWIAFVDADDYVAEGIFKRCIEVLKCKTPDILDYQYFGNFNGIIYPAQMSQIPKDTLLDREYLVQNIIPVMVNVSDKKEYFINDFAWAKAFRTEIIRCNDILFDDTRRTWEDRLFTVEFLKYAQSYYSMSAYGYYYVGHSWGESLSTSFDKNILCIVIDSCKKYRALYGDLYDFDQPYTINYYCNLLSRIAIDQFRHDIEPVQREKMFAVFTEDPTVLELFSRFEPKKKWETEMQSAILNCEQKRLYAILNGQYSKRKQKEISDKVKNAFYRVFTGIKRRLIKRVEEK